MSTAIVTSDTSEDHITGDGHPEQPKRVSAVVRRLKKRKNLLWVCLLYTSPSPRDATLSRMPSSA